MLCTVECILCHVTTRLYHTVYLAEKVGYFTLQRTVAAVKR